MTYARTKVTTPIVCSTLLIISITTFWIVGQQALAIKGQTLSIPIESRGIAIGSPGLLSGNIIQVPIHGITHVFRFPIGIQGKGTQDLVQVPINIPINECGNTVNVITVIGNTCNNSK